jgi:hypothetical protein
MDFLSYCKFFLIALNSLENYIHLNSKICYNDLNSIKQVPSCLIEIYFIVVSVFKLPVLL